MSETALDDQLADVVAKQAITEVLYRYCRGLDRMDRPMVDTVWHPGGTGDYGAIFNGTGEEFLDWVWPVHASMRRHSHQITNVLIEVDGDTAISEAYVTVCLRNEAEPGHLVDIVSRGRYVDRWSLARRALGHRPPPLRGRPDQRVRRPGVAHDRRVAHGRGPRPHRPVVHAFQMTLRGITC